ncbi:MAG: TrbC/VirB2 family protein [Bradyrhizobium sp.]
MRARIFDTMTNAAAQARLRRLADSPWFWLALLAAAIVICTGDAAQASDAGGGGAAGLPWEGPLDKIKRSMSGPVAFVIALLGIIACGATLIWGGEVSEFARRIVYVVLVISIIVFANSMLTGVLFSGATVPDGLMLNLAGG